MDPGGVKTSATLFKIPDLRSYLVDILSDDLELTVEDILHPKRDLNKTQMIYYSMLNELGLTTNLSDKGFDDNYHIHPEIPSDLEQHPEVFQDTIALDKLLSRCRRFFQDIQHDDPVPFSLDDLLEPDSKRFRRFLASFVNFWNFCNLQHPYINEQKEAIDGRAQKINRIGEENSRMSEEIHVVRRRQAKDKMESQDLADQREKKMQDLSQLEKAKNNLLAEKDETKAAMEESARVRKELDQELAKLESRCKQLHFLLNDEVVSAKMDDELQELSEYQVTQQSLEANLRVKLADVSDQRSDATAILQQMEVVDHKLAEIKVLNTDHKNMGRSLTSAQQQCEAAEKDLIYTKQKMRELKAKEADLKSQWNKRREMKEAECRQLHKTSDDMKSNMSDYERNVFLYRERESKLASAESEAREKHEQLLNLYVGLYLKMADKAKSFNKTIEAEISKVDKKRKELMEAMSS